MTLVEALEDPQRRRAVIRDAAALVDSEVASKRGLSGMALRTGLKTMKRVKRGIVEESLDMLLPKFAPAIDPWWSKALESGDPQRFFDANSAAIAESLLSGTDARAKVAKNRVLIKVYSSLRSQAATHTAAAVPKLPPLIQRNTG